jgi:hypothetical protein
MSKSRGMTKNTIGKGVGRHKDADGMLVILLMMMVKVKRTNGVSGCPGYFLP